MIESYILHTAEIDDVDAALAEINAQAKVLALRAHTVGLVVCHHDYIATGVLAALEQALPFPLVGFTSFYQVVPAAGGLFELTITVLSSDEVSFALACSAGDEENANPAAVVQATYAAAAAKLGGPPALMFSFFAVQRPVSGDEYLRLLDGCSGGVPVFGGVATGDAEAGKDVFVLCAGQVLPSGFALLLLQGPVQAGFSMGNFHLDRLLEMTATVTRAKGEWVQELNGQPAAEYLRKHGFRLPKEEKDLVSNIPFLYKMPEDINPIARTLCGFDETGALHFFGEVPEGALLRISSISNEELLAVSVEATQKAIKAHPNPAVVLALSCVGRYIAQGLDPTLEMAHIIKVLPPGTPYLACYVGGEACPIVERGKEGNRYHNNSFVVCTLN